MTNQSKTKRILWYEGLGFLFLILLSWLDELISLPQLIFGEVPHPGSIHEAIIETVAIVAVGIVVLFFTKRLMQRLFYLEDFLRVCAWCRKIGYDGKWITLEDYFDQGFGIQTSHGMCPECLIRWAEKVKETP